MVRSATSIFVCAVAALCTVASSGAAAQASSSGSSPLNLSGFAALPPTSTNSIWTQTVDGAGQALDPSSAALVGTLLADVNKEQAGNYGPWINTTKYSVPVYDVPAGQPLVPVTLTRPYSSALTASFAAGVPIPPGAKPAAGTDEHMVIYQPSSDTMWEFWHMAQNTQGQWSAAWGGTMTNASQNPGYFSGADAGWGATASSLPLVDGLITPAELQSGQINHALSFAIPYPRGKVWASPAQRTDGGNTSTTAIPEGARFRIDPTLNLASLNLPPATLAIATAAQKYGMIVRDTAGVVTFYAQDPTPTGSNPYPTLFGGSRCRRSSRSFPGATCSSSR